MIRSLLFGPPAEQKRRLSILQNDITNTSNKEKAIIIAADARRQVVLNGKMLPNGRVNSPSLTCLLPRGCKARRKHFKRGMRTYFSSGRDVFKQYSLGCIVRYIKSTSDVFVRDRLELIPNEIVQNSGDFFES